MYDDDGWESEQDEELIWRGDRAAGRQGADGKAAGTSLESVLDGWIGVAGDAARARQQVRADIGRLKGQAACRRRLIEMVQEQKYLLENLGDAFAEE